MYLARVNEVAEHLLSARGGHVSTCLLESRRYSRGLGTGHTDTIPARWRCSVERIESV
jgi:hypothetical protein